MQNEIETKLKNFKETWQCCKEDDLFAELIFCLLTPQSRAKICWNVVENLKEDGLLLKGNKEQIAKKLKGVRFKNKKAEYIINARKTFSENGGLAVKSKLSHFSTPYEMRDYLVQNVKGMGYKEASHFYEISGLGKN